MTKINAAAMRDQVLVVLADYQGCTKRDGFYAKEGDGQRESQEIAKRVVDNFMVLASPKERPTLKEKRIVEVLYIQAIDSLDPWGACKGQVTRNIFADTIMEILTRPGKG